MAQSIPLVEIALDPLTDLNFLKLSFVHAGFKQYLISAGPALYELYIFGFVL